MASEPTSETLYTYGSLGRSLMDTIDELVVNKRQIPPQLGARVVHCFSRIVPKVLSQQPRTKLTMKGKLDTYRHCDEMWNFLARNVTLTLDNKERIHASKIKIVCGNSKPDKDE
ncbi:transcription initiation factor IIA, gamma subunit-domain-containing protein [Podospora didyma]|uniref:Transcription initiation factor IIA subunit 2 n=1 Tax=Podospora didyma TaxID=330526 RepID=A0AAE0K695_9PEZI|nr:transcription initiation factor IIA, gamma subunit-domain-containing protein [Podospora didyma]